MNFKDLKKQIYDDKKIEYLLLRLDCQYIHTEQHGEIYAAMLPSRFGSNNRRSVQVVNNEQLSAYIRSKGISGDIYAVVGYILYGISDFYQIKDKIFDIKNWICEELGYTDFGNFIGITPFDKNNCNSWLDDIKKDRLEYNEEELIRENEIIDESVLNKYANMPSYYFYKEGINYKTQWQFGVRFDPYSNRVVFPIHNQDGKLVGVKGRYVGPDLYTMEEIKYLYLEKCDKSLELYNLHRAIPYIEERGEVIIVEGAKTVMLLWQWGIRNCISTEGKSLSKTQIKKIKNLKCKITFAFDKDVSVEFIRSHCKHFTNRLVYAMIDIDNNLKDKDSPTDKGREVWDCLYENKIAIIS